MIEPGQRMKPIVGTAAVGKSTKRLLERMGRRSIAVIDHEDVDRLAARGLIEAKALAVVNAGRTMTGRIPSDAALLLLDAGIPIVEIDPEAMERISDGSRLTITSAGVHWSDGWSPCRAFTRADWRRLHELAVSRVNDEWARFIDNTLIFAERDKKLLLAPLRLDGLTTALAGRHAVVVCRGDGYREDLAALRSYIAAFSPVLIGVDGGADALLELGLRPDMIVGDMDSVSDRALRSGAELIVHGYLSGEAPGLARVRGLGLDAAVLRCAGTSEDLAMLIAFDGRCEQIVSVGSHIHMFDFLEKGRGGMASTWLVRMKVGSKLIDAKGISRLQLSPRAPLAERANQWAAWARSCLTGKRRWKNVFTRVGRYPRME